MVSGLTTPEKRMYSLPWLMAICFSPDTSRLPLASASITVTVMVPEKLLFAAALPEPSKLDEVLASALSPTSAPSGSLLRPLMPPLMEELRSVLLVLFFVAEVCSTS